MNLEIKKGIEYDYHTDSIYDQPECPYCGMPIFDISLKDIGEQICCECCGGSVFVKDSDWLRKYIKDFIGEKTEKQECSNCGGSMTVHLIKRNGEWRTFSGECENCGIRFIV